ncbi:MAG: hypothetical protein M3Q95_00740 [Bacteroidota bacterium]|nr:hypothetical protein [Bacteroidota bacterium]
MKSFCLLTVFFFYTVSAVVAQRPPTDPKHENHYVVAPVENDDLKITFKNAHSQQEFTLVEMTITNKTSDFLYCKGSEAKFIFDHGTYNPKGNLLSRVNFSIGPLETVSKTLKVSGDAKFHAEKLQLELNCFYKISSKGEVLKAPDFQLPAAKNSFSAGDCNCTLEKAKQTTQETAAKFKCTYSGKKVAFIDPSKLSVKLKDGQEFANNNRKDKGDILMPGDEISFTAIFIIPGQIADMQFTVLNISWNETFSESGMIPVKVGTVDFVLDSGVTLLKNK